MYMCMQGTHLFVMNMEIVLQKPVPVTSIGPPLTTCQSCPQRFDGSRLLDLMKSVNWSRIAHFDLGMLVSLHLVLQASSRQCIKIVF